MRVYAGLFLLSAATLTYEINLSRIFSVAQFYHFAFMVVSLALLGYGASGTFLSLFPQAKKRQGARSLVWLGLGFAFTSVGGYALTVHVPFDSFRIAHDWRQAGILLVHYIALAMPFFCSGTAVALLLASTPGRAGGIYAASLVGSAAGCVLAIVTPSFVGGEGVVLLSSALGLAASIIFDSPSQALPRFTHGYSAAAVRVLRVVQGVSLLVLVLAAFRTPAFLRITLSPYK
ncbi:MAG: hypothetical protein PVJ55_02980, partial [Anaerolineae bacterium]